MCVKVAKPSRRSFPVTAQGFLKGALDNEREPVTQAAPIGFRHLSRLFKVFFADAKVSCWHMVNPSAFT